MPDLPASLAHSLPRPTSTDVRAAANPFPDLDSLPPLPESVNNSPQRLPNGIIPKNTLPDSANSTTNSKSNLNYGSYFGSSYNAEILKSINLTRSATFSPAKSSSPTKCTAVGSSSDISGHVLSPSRSHGLLPNSRQGDEPSGLAHSPLRTHPIVSNIGLPSTAQSRNFISTGLMNLVPLAARSRLASSGVLIHASTSPIKETVDPVPLRGRPIPVQAEGPHSSTIFGHIYGYIAMRCWALYSLALGSLGSTRKTIHSSYSQVISYLNMPAIHAPAGSSRFNPLFTFLALWSSIGIPVMIRILDISERMLGIVLGRLVVCVAVLSVSPWFLVLSFALSITASIIDKICLVAANWAGDESENFKRGANSSANSS